MSEYLQSELPAIELFQKLGYEHINANYFSRPYSKILEEKKVIKTKYFLYAFKYRENEKYQYWYETDTKYFRENKPPKSILDANITVVYSMQQESVIANPWEEWQSNNIQKIIAKNGVCINYLKSTDSDMIQKCEDLRLLELYDRLVEHLDISKPFGFDTVMEWHKEIFEPIYPFAGMLRTVEMSKGSGMEAWVWRLDFLNAVPALDILMEEITKKNYEEIDAITYDLSRLLSDFLFIHPFREGNGRVSRLICDIILAKNGLPMIGLNLKNSDNYIHRVHEGYHCNYKPMQELLKIKLEKIMNG